MAETTTLDIGHTISGLGHAGLLGWLVLGGISQPALQPFKVREVAIISVQEFDKLVAAETQPKLIEDSVPPHVMTIEPDVPDKLPAVDLDVSKPEVPKTPQSTAPETITETDLVAVLAPSDPSDFLTEPKPPEPLVTTAAPQREDPPATKTMPEIAPAPEIPPAPAPPSLAPQQMLIEEATSEMVIERKEPVSTALARSLRPKLRPVNVAPIQVDTVVLALQEAMSMPNPDVSETPRSSTGLPMTLGEQEALRLAVKPCWFVDPGSLSANIVVTLAMQMTPDGKLVASSVRMINSIGGEGAALKKAEQAARGAVLRCSKKMGANLPPEKYEQWRNIELLFDPAEMRTP